MRNMFWILDSALSDAEVMIRDLDFFNAVMTSIFICFFHRHEFSVLQSIGMTGRQLVKMLVDKELRHVGVTVAPSLVLNLLAGLILQDSVCIMPWFFTCCFTILPLAIVLPLFVILDSVILAIVFQFVFDQMIGERL